MIGASLIWCLNRQIERISCLIKLIMNIEVMGLANASRLLQWHAVTSRRPIEKHITISKNGAHGVVAYRTKQLVGGANPKPTAQSVFAGA